MRTTCVCLLVMTRQKAREALLKHTRDSALVDHVLKRMDKVIVGDMVVSRAKNPSTALIQYTVQEPLPAPAGGPGIDDVY
ncbi:hypothetical protein U1Q18_049204 [Sarracenia purpurea var. burkii]